MSGGAELVAPVPGCCAAWVDRVADADSLVRWYPHVLGARVERLTYRSEWLAVCPFCGGALPDVRVHEFEHETGIAWDSPQVGAVAVGAQNGAGWLREPGVAAIPWPFLLRTEPLSEDMLTTLRDLAGLLDLSFDSYPAEVGVADLGDVWLGDPGTSADEVHVVRGVDWDGGVVTAVVESAGMSLRRLCVARDDGGLVVVGPHLTWRSSSDYV